MKKTLQKRFILFLGACIPSRLLFAYFAKNGSLIIKKILALTALVIATGFLFIYISGIRKTGIETGGEIIWWNDLRPIHALLYYIFSILVLFSNYQDAWVVIVFDTIIGLISFIIYHLKNSI